MKIVHIPTGEAYQLSPDTCLEVERTNLFFNEYGEQTLPVTLPDTPLNRRLTGNPEQLANLERPSTDIECTITDGEYFCTCRQAVLGARRNEGITTTFYMNEGSFLSRLQRTPLTDVFGSETVPGVQTVEQGIAWCWSLRTNTDPNFSIFPTIVEMDGERRVLNAMAEMEADGTPLNNGRTVTGLYNAWSRTEQVDGRTISLTPGYYITPFIRCTYVLRRVFAYFGYELLEGFFDKTPPFNGMVFINTTMDTLVNGDILLAHLVPDCLCSDLIDLFRKKFCCEFIPDEAARTVAVRFFNELLDEKPQVDLTFFMDGHPSVEYATRRQLKLSSATSLTDCTSFDSLKELKEKYPTAYCNASNGCYYRDGHAVGDYSELLSEGNIPYLQMTDWKNMRLLYLIASLVLPRQPSIPNTALTVMAMPIQPLPWKGVLCMPEKQGHSTVPSSSVTVPLKRRKAEKALPKGTRLTGTTRSRYWHSCSPVRDQ